MNTLLSRLLTVLLFALICHVYVMYIYLGHVGLCMSWASVCDMYVKAPSHQTSSHYVLENVAKTGSNGVRTE